MPHYRSTGNLAIRPCEICSVLVLHEEGAPEGDGASQLDRWRAFPHNAPGGASCIGGGAAARAHRVAARQPPPLRIAPLDYEPA